MNLESNELDTYLESITPTLKYIELPDHLFSYIGIKPPLVLSNWLEKLEIDYALRETENVEDIAVQDVSPSEEDDIPLFKLIQNFRHSNLLSEPSEELNKEQLCGTTHIYEESFETKSDIVKDKKINIKETDYTTSDGLSEDDTLKLKKKKTFQKRRRRTKEPVLVINRPRGRPRKQCVPANEPCNNITDSFEIQVEKSKENFDPEETVVDFKSKENFDPQKAVVDLDENSFESLPANSPIWSDKEEKNEIQNELKDDANIKYELNINDCTVEKLESDEIASDNQVSFDIESEEIIKTSKKKGKRKKKPSKNIDLKNNKKFVFPCEECGKSFSAKSTLKYHLRVHNGTLLKCGTCSKGFTTNYQLKCHERLHTGNLFMCDVCAKGFITAEMLKVHSRGHTGNKPFACSQCDKAFSSASNLTQHKEVHDPVRKYLCSTCGAAFNQRRSLDCHMLSHGEKHHVCTTCGKMWARKSDLVEHMRIHTGYKPYACNKCSQRFTQTSSLRRHKTTHEVSIPVTCGVCSKKFKTDAYYKQHFRKIHLLHPTMVD